MTRYGRLTVSKRHVMGQYDSSFGISAYLQEKLVYVGQKEVYEEASATLEHLMDLQVCANLAIEYRLDRAALPSLGSLL